MPNEAAIAGRNTSVPEVSREIDESLVKEVANIPIMIGGKMHLIGTYFDVAVHDDGSVYIFSKNNERMDTTTFSVVGLTGINESKRNLTFIAASYKGVRCIVVQEKK